MNANFGHRSLEKVFDGLPGREGAAMLHSSMTSSPSAATDALGHPGAA